MRWFSSDFHIGHYNVIEYCNRPFKTIFIMNETIIHNWNSLVSPDDDMYFLGDLCMNHKYLYMLNRFNFSKMIWVLGNHDKIRKIHREMDEGGALFDIRDKIIIHEKGYIIDIDGKAFELIHRPMVCNDKLPVICGHVHERWKFIPIGTHIKEHGRNKTSLEKVVKVPVLNVGVDQNNFFPMNEHQILEYFNG